MKARPAPSWKDQVLRARKDLSFSSSLLQDQLEYSHLFVWAVIFPRAQLQRGPLRSSGSLVQSSGIAPVASSSSLEDDDASSKATQGGKVPTGYSQLGSGATFSYFQAILKSISPRAFCKAEHWCDQKEMINQAKMSTPKILNRPAYEDA